MKTDGGKFLQNYFSFLAYLLSGFFIFNPIFSSSNTIISLIISLITAFSVFELLLIFFSRVKTPTSNSTKTAKVLSFLCLLFSSLSTLILITEVIRSAAFITNRYISLLYYIALSAAILGVSLNLCLGKAKGIFRFSILASTVLIIFCLISPLSFITSAKLLPEFDLSSGILRAVKHGFLSGLFISADTAIFLFDFNQYVGKGNSTISKKALRFALFTCYFLISLFVLSAKLIFSDKLLCALDNPAYTLTKLIPGNDFTELLSCVLIISFMIKSSVYIHASSEILHKLFKANNMTVSKYTLVGYAFVPIIYLFALIFKKSLPYGAYQEYIYALIIMLSLLFLLVQKASQKKK